MKSDAASDVSMHTAPSHVPPSPRPLSQAAHSIAAGLEPPKLDLITDRPPSPMVLDEPVAAEPSLDLMLRIPGMYRLLDLVQERGSGGLVDKIIIAQQSIAAFANRIRPGSYRSDIQVDFKGLDEHTIKPRGIYGSASALVDFLDTIGCMNPEARGWLLRQRDDFSGVSQPTLRPGLYLVDPPNNDTGRTYIVFWPEDGTWNDGAISSVSRNRVTFMRYLTKLCEQVDCLISDEHADQLVWKDEMAQGNTEDEDLDGFDDRMFGYTVEQTNEEEESANVEEGFLIRHRFIEQVDQIPNGYPTNRDLEILQPRLITGETSQALLTTQFIPEETKSVAVDERLKTLALKEKLKSSQSPLIHFSRRMDHASLHTILEHGLWERCGDLKSKWNARCLKESSQREDDKKAETRRRRAATRSQFLDSEIAIWVAKQAAVAYSIIPEHTLFQAALSPGTELEAGQCEMAIAKVVSWLEQHPALRLKITKDLANELITLDPSPTIRYTTLKRQLLHVLGLLAAEDLNLSDQEIQRLADLVRANDTVFKKEVDNILNADKKANRLGIAKRFLSYIPWGGASPTKRQNSTITLPLQDDPSFTKSLEMLANDQPQFLPAIDELKLQAEELLKRKIKKISSSLPKVIRGSLQKEMDDEIRDSFEQRRQKEEKEAWELLQEQVKQCLNDSIPRRNNGNQLTIESVVCETSGRNAFPETFHFKGVLSSPNKAGFEHTIFPILITRDDFGALSTNPDHACKPIIRSHGTHPISLPTNAAMRFIHLLENDIAFVVIEELDQFQVYLENIDLLPSAIAQRKVIKIFHVDKLGRDPLFTLDSTRHLLVVFATSKGSIQLNVYSFDSTTRSLNARGSPENLTRWYQRIPEVTHMVFVCGTEELLLIEKGGMCRMFSLVTANFRPSTLRLVGDPESAFSSPDGACLIVKVSALDGPRLFCYHWASFGSKEGTEIPWPDQIPHDSKMIVSAVGIRQSTQIIFIAPGEALCQSLRVRITSKSSEFAFRSNLNHNGHSAASAQTINNSLIDCHAEVWTRFPVNAAIVKETVANAIHQPRSILFVSNTTPNAFAFYFESMVREFEYKTRKPTKDILKRTIIKDSTDWGASSSTVATSEFQIGDWLVGLLCLIPIHLAVTRSNRFIPLKDGVDSATFEHSLLGANVAQISEALSFGWYESIFSSYLANKPVKVVTSMGEQSVGKSFALNHFVDTSFAGSAMRCTEGVWLSVTPTRDYLVVAMDFEGVHSIERSAQEDTLLVLLNSAISNFVLFRNNFALSRDITGLFNSFQSCTKVLDPASNPSLFHSTLGIIIKDVIDSDTREIVNEFHQKFQRIVQKERAENFISKLHRGKLDIIPWPVIESARFYDLFVALKKRLDKQPITHTHAGAFLGVLKMLMAKLKANDWGALDQNLAVQRAQQLGSFLPFALAFGTTDPVNEEPLKNYDTDERLPNNDSFAVFFIEGLSHPIDGPLSLNSCLKQLRKGWEHIKDRYSMGEQDFFTGYNRHLSALAEARISHVQAWIETNSSRFGEKAEITALRRTFDQLSKELRASAVLCGSKCTSCGLLCLEHKQHDGDDNCMTDHMCPKLCGFADEHEETVACDLPAGHIGRHVCAGASHLCGTTCHMYGRNGCLTSCAKPMNHDDDEGHQCAAGIHTCGELCSLVEKDGNRLCTRRCTLDCRIDHEQHTCDRSLSCPMKCQLCKSYCAAGDHFHALQPDAVHLCGQKHNCTYNCELEGVCEINTTPQSIESTFVGRHATFQYTKYTQEARRLKCIISLAPDQLEHDGRHVHSNDPNPFHHCEERCKYCEYYCTLPLGHVQPLHSTNHGSMEQTEWIVEGDDDATLELQGHKGGTKTGSLIDSSGLEVGLKASHTAEIEWWSEVDKSVDPYSQEQQDEFGLCDHRCGGAEHDGDENNSAIPSYCILPLFHGPPDPTDAPALGHVSHDGHAYKCKNPMLMQRSFHIFFVLDHSGSMTSTDRQPLPDSPATQRITQSANNRFGAVLSSLYGFWTAREAAIRAGANAGQRRDAYSIIPFESSASVALSNDTVSDPDQLLDLTLGNANYYGGTNFTAAIKTIQAQMEATWVSERSPVVIFLSDGECSIEDTTTYDLCRAASRLGKALAFHAVSFGTERQSHYLRRMAAIAHEVYATGPVDPLAPAGVNPCSYSSALDTIQLATTFLSLAESLKNPRAALSRV